jgi:ParB family chromosome partitioning protein
MFKATSTSDDSVPELRELALDAIEPNPSQPRRYFDEAALQDLAGSIDEHGVLQPVLVRPRPDGKYELTAGERRWRAAQIAGLQTIPALVSRYDDAVALEVAVIENMAREDLNPIEEARACTRLIEELGLTHEQVGQRVGRTRGVVTNLVRLLQLSEEIIAFLERAELQEGHGRALLIAKDLKVRSQLARVAVEEGWSVRVLEGRARASNMDVPDKPRPGRRDQAREQGTDQTQDMAALNVARVWGDALGAEVHVRTMPNRKLRLELVFDSPEGALALGGQIGELIARGAKRS